jgi:hypothetical protein
LAIARVSVSGLGALELELELELKKTEIGTISRKTSDSTDKFNCQNLLDIAVTNALELLRGQNFEN